MNYNSYSPYYSTDINYMQTAQQTSYIYSGYYPYSYYTYECAPIYNNACYAHHQQQPPQTIPAESVPSSRLSSKKSTISTTSNTKTSNRIVNYKPERIVERLSESKSESEQDRLTEASTTITTTSTNTATTATSTNESKPAQQNVHSTDDFEFIEIKGIRGIWVKKDATKNPSIMINNYILDTEKEKLIEDCEPSDPLVIRERPPELPKPLSQRVFTVPGKRMSPPPRRVIIEKQPPQPQTTKVIVERWLPYEKQERRVILQKPACEPAPAEKPKNLIIEWEQAPASTEKKVQILGVESADPNEYIAKYGPTLKSKAELPKFALNVKGPDGINLDDTITSSKVDHRLVGDLEGLNLIDLDKEGLSMYKKYIDSKK